MSLLGDSIRDKVPGAGSALLGLSLYSVKIGGRPRLLLQRISTTLDALDLGYGRRCVPCA